MPRKANKPCPMTFSGSRVRRCKQSDQCPWWIPNESETGGDCSIVWLAISLSMIANEGVPAREATEVRPKAGKRRRRDNTKEARP